MLFSCVSDFFSGGFGPKQWFYPRLKPWEGQFRTRYGAGKTVAEAVREAKANQEAEQEEVQENPQDAPPFPENGIAR